MSEVEARMDGMLKAFIDSYRISGGQKIAFDNTGKFQDDRLNIEYHGYWCGWLDKKNQLPQYCTPEQHKKLTGEDWPDDVPIWIRWTESKIWTVSCLESLKRDKLIDHPELFRVIVQTGKAAPPIDYRPESANV